MRRWRKIVPHTHSGLRRVWVEYHGLGLSSVWPSKTRFLPHKRWPYGLCGFSCSDSGGLGTNNRFRPEKTRVCCRKWCNFVITAIVFLVAFLSPIVMRERMKDDLSESRYWFSPGFSQQRAMNKSSSEGSRNYVMRTFKKVRCWLECWVPDDHKYHVAFSLAFALSRRWMNPYGEWSKMSSKRTQNLQNNRSWSY